MTVINVANPLELADGQKAKFIRFNPDNNTILVTVGNQTPRRVFRVDGSHYYNELPNLRNVVSKVEFAVGDTVEFSNGTQKNIKVISLTGVGDKPMIIQFPNGGLTTRQLDGYDGYGGYYPQVVKSAPEPIVTKEYVSVFNNGAVGTPYDSQPTDNGSRLGYIERTLSDGVFVSAKLVSFCKD